MVGLSLLGRSLTEAKCEKQRLLGYLIRTRSDFVGLVEFMICVGKDQTQFVFVIRYWAFGS
jgi:hypothetical protein